MALGWFTSGSGTAYLVCRLILDHFMWNHNTIQYSWVKCFLLIRGPRSKEQPKKHSILISFHISKGLPHPQFSLIADLDCLSVVVNICTSYLATSIEDHLKVVTSVLTMKFFNSLLWIKNKKPIIMHTLEKNAVSYN